MKEEKAKIKIIGDIRITDDNDILYGIDDIEFIGDNEDKVLKEIEDYLIYKLSDYLGIEEKEIRENATEFGDPDYFGYTYDKNTCNTCPDKENCEYLKNNEYCEYSYIPYTIDFYVKERIEKEELENEKREN